MLVRHYLPSKHLFQLINRSTGKMSEICSKLKIKTPERHHWRRSNVFIVNFEYFTPFCSVSIVEFRVWLCICLLGIDFGAIQNICYEQNGIFYPPMSRPVILFSNSLLLCFRGTKSWVAEKMSKEKFLVIGITFFTVLSLPYIAFCYFSHEPSSPLPEWCTSWMIPCSSKPRFFGSFFQGYLCDLSS